MNSERGALSHSDSSTLGRAARLDQREDVGVGGIARTRMSNRCDKRHDTRPEVGGTRAGQAGDGGRQPSHCWKGWYPGPDDSPLP